MPNERPPAALSEAVQELIRADLQPSQLQVHTKLSLAVMTGSLISLSLCGQFGYGVTHWAESLNHQMHQAMSPVTCAVICGVIYAVFPTVLLRIFLCSPLQFRVILRKHLPSVLLWYASVGSFLAYHGNHGQGAVELGSWILSALLTSHALSWFFRFFLRDWSFADVWRRVS